MNWADYVLQNPMTLEGRRRLASEQYRKEKMREYSRKSKAKKREQKCTNTKQPLKT